MRKNHPSICKTGCPEQHQWQKKEIRSLKIHLLLGVKFFCLYFKLAPLVLEI